MPMPKPEYAVCRYCGHSIEKVGEGHWRHTSSNVQKNNEDLGDGHNANPGKK